jgi:hypothetical protein
MRPKPAAIDFCIYDQAIQESLRPAESSSHPPQRREVRGDAKFQFVAKTVAAAIAHGFIPRNSMTPEEGVALDASLQRRPAKMRGGGCHIAV